MRPKELKHLQAKSKKLVVHMARPKHPEGEYIVVVSSDSTETRSHIVTIRFDKQGIIKARCTCPWAQYGGMACTHVIAALSRLAAQKQRALSFWLDPEAARRQKHALFDLNAGGEHVWITSRPAA